MIIRTGKSLSDVLIYTSINPQYDNRLFNDLRVQYEKMPSSEHVENVLCTQIVLNIKTKNMTTWPSKYSLGTAELEKNISKVIVLIIRPKRFKQKIRLHQNLTKIFLYFCPEEKSMFGNFIITEKIVA